MDNPFESRNKWFDPKCQCVKHLCCVSSAKPNTQRVKQQPVRMELRKKNRSINTNGWRGVSISVTLTVRKHIHSNTSVTEPCSRCLCIYSTMNVTNADPHTNDTKYTERCVAAQGIFVFRIQYNTRKSINTLNKRIYLYV